MENKTPEPMTPFDELVSSPALQAVKLLIPYTPASGRQMLAAFVKLQELRQTIQIFGRRQGGLSAQALDKSPPSSIFDILISLKPYLSKRDAEMLDMILNLKELMETAQMMKEAAAAQDDGGDFSPMDLLAGMLTPEQQEAFHMYESMFSQPPDNVKKGDDANERMDEQSADAEYGPGEAGAD